jgi:hypothetical protein
MRCFFHLVNGREAILDEAGIEVADLETAKLQALKAITELRQEVDGANDEWNGWRLDIECPAGSVLYSIGLDVVLH